MNWIVVTFLTKLGHIVFSDGVENIFFSRKMAVTKSQIKYLTTSLKNLT